MIQLFILVLSLIGAISGQFDDECACRVPTLDRKLCLSNPFAFTKQDCEDSGCCWNSVFILFGPRCFSKDARFCPAQGTQDTQCHMAFPPQACNLALGREFCVSQGCCYNPEISPFCFHKAGSIPIPTLEPVSDWTRWSACSSACSPGSSTRTRQCLAAFPQTCTARGLTLSESRQCNGHLCQQWGVWMRSSCSVTCGTGRFTNRRNCQGSGAIGPNRCHQTTSQCTLDACNFFDPLFPIFRPPVVTAVWGQWQAWSTCSRSCTPGRRTRTRGCFAQGRQVDAIRCPATVMGVHVATHTEACNTDMCAFWTGWSKYSHCPETCGETLTRESSRTCRNKRPPVQPTDAFLSCSKIRINCDLLPCPTVPETYPDTFDWRTTSQPSTAVQSTTTRFFPTASEGTIFEFTPPSSAPTFTTRPTASTSGETIFEFTLTESGQGFTTPTTQAPMEVPKLGPWLPWSPCPVTCGRGIRRRFKSCVYSDGKQADRSQCESHHGSAICRRGPCPTTTGSTTSTTTQSTTSTTTELPASWASWGPWNSCSQSCGSGQKIRNRDCTYRDGRVVEQNECSSGDHFDLTSCNEHPCPIESTTTGSTTSTTAESTTFTTATESTTSTTTAESTTEPTPSWESWGQWTPCSTSCSLGVKIRIRVCVYSDGKATDSTECSDEPSVESDSCNERQCPPDPTTIQTTPSTTTTPAAVPSWEPWMAWSECSSTCSPGIKSRRRKCIYSDGEEIADSTECGPQFSSEEVLSCNDKLCAEWKAWTELPCTVTCLSGPDASPGLVVKSRECAVTAKETANEKCYVIATLCNVNQPCPESTTITTPTTTSSTTMEPTTQPPTSPTTLQPFSPVGPSIWAEWGEWSECSSSCSPGVQNRARRCLEDIPAQFCIEGAVDSQECNMDMCSGWSEWRNEPCDKTCGDGGTQVRRRICLSGQGTETAPGACYRLEQPCSLNPLCEGDIIPAGESDPKLDVLFLVDSSNHVDDCEAIEQNTGLTPPLRGNQLNSTIAPTYSRIKKFIADFVNGWRGISDEGTRISIQLFSNLCSPRTKSNLHVEKRFNESHEQLVAKYIEDLPYLCGDYWLDWALQCAISPVLTTPFGDREDVPNVVVAILSNAPTTSQPNDTLLKIILRKLVGKDSTVLSAAATPMGTLGPKSRAKYEENIRKISCENGKACPAYLGSIWDIENADAADAVRLALREDE